MKEAINYADFDESRAITQQTIPRGYHGDAGVVLDNIVGDEDSPVVLIEYLDLQCPVCRDLSASMHTIIEKFKGQAAFVGRYFPLPQHANAIAASIAVEAAARQGKFAMMSRAVFIGQPEWQDLEGHRLTRAFEEYAGSIGLDTKQWLADYENAATNGIADKITFQTNLGIWNDVDATPTIEINGQRLEIADKATVIEVIEDELAMLR